MATRAVICIGVNRAGSMTPLQAAVEGAKDFEAWAKGQGCDTALLVDEPGPKKVGVADIFDAIELFVEARTYRQLIIYFSGHGILTAPGTEFWLLSRGPQNPNEAVNLARSITDARNSGLPHVIFVSDACRSSVAGPPLSGVTGGLIFPNLPFAERQGEVDVYYATRPGDPAYEVPEAQATQRYRGLFTDALLTAVRYPKSVLVDFIPGTLKPVITSRKLKGFLEDVVPNDAADVDIRLRQAPQVIVETAYPKFMAEVDPTRIVPMRGFELVEPGPLSVDRAIQTLGAATQFGGPDSVLDSPRVVGPSRNSALKNEFDQLAELSGRQGFETQTGFTVIGAHHVEVESGEWQHDPPFSDPGDEPDCWHIRLKSPAAPRGRLNSCTILLSLDGTTATALAILPEFVGTVKVENGRVTSVSYTPSVNSWRYGDYSRRLSELNRMRAFAAVASRNGRFVVADENAAALAKRIRQNKSIDPTLGLYAAYAYAQAGAYRDVYSVYNYMSMDEPSMPIPFDVGMLAARFDANAIQEAHRFAPFFPMLAQGWAYLAHGDPLYDPIHGELRQHMLPSLWTTFDRVGAQLIGNAIQSGRFR